MEEGRLASVSVGAVQVYYQGTVSRETYIFPVFPVLFTHLSFRAYECVGYVFCSWRSRWAQSIFLYILPNSIPCMSIIGFGFFMGFLLRRQRRRLLFLLLTSDICCVLFWDSYICLNKVCSISR